MTTTLDRCLSRHAATQPDKIFWRQLSDEDVTETSFGAFELLCRSFAHAYLATGISAGQTVLIFLPHSVEAVAAFFGAVQVGAVPAFMPLPSAKQHASVYWPAHTALLQRIAPHLLVSDAENAAQMRAHGITGGAGIIALEEVRRNHSALPVLPADPDKVALLQHSSGTTGLKKGVCLSHRAILRQAEAYAGRLDMTGADNIVSWLPLYHDMGLIACTVIPMVLGQTVTTISPFEWVTRPSSLFDIADRYDGHFAWLPNFAFEHLVRTVDSHCTADLSRMRAFIDCSEPCKPESFERFAASFARLGVRREQLQVCYAMAETVFAVSQTAPGRVARTLCIDVNALQQADLAADATGETAMRVLSNGRPLPGLDVKIRHDGQDVGDSHAGEIVIRGDFLFDGYNKDAETTAARLRDGWYHTRDRGFLRDGELYVLGRIDDLLIINGRNLHAHEVEALVSEVAGLKAGRAAAFGVFNDRIGSEELVVVAERDPDAPAPLADAALRRAVRDAVYEQTNIEVNVCRIVDPGWLVKTTSGKVSREANRAKYVAATEEEARQAAPAGGAQAGTLGHLCGFIAARFRQAPGTITGETVAADVQGWDSLAHATLILAIEGEFGVRFADREMFGFACVGDIARRIDELKAAGPDAALPERLVHKTANASIVRMGESDAPDVIIFAGRETAFENAELLSFSSIFAQIPGGDARKFFVTDHNLDWYATCFDEVAEKLNQLSDRPKLLFGNSMGGYAAMRFAPVLKNVIAVLSLVPQARTPPKYGKPFGKPRGYWHTRLTPGIKYCVVFGELGDQRSQAHLRNEMVNHDDTRMIIVPHCGHNLVLHLHQQNLLAPVVAAMFRPETMADEIEKVLSIAKARPLGDGQIRRRFEKANVPADGRLTQKQAGPWLPEAASSFAEIDTGKRGYVTLDEVLAFYGERRIRARREAALQG